MRILAIDPGFGRLGIAIIDKKNGNKATFVKNYGALMEELVFSMCFKTDKKKTLNERVFLIGQKIESIIKKYKPKALAIEKLFFTTNQKTAMAVSEARGVVLYEATKAKLPIYEYTPLEIKMAITGYGKADKGQIMRMLPKLIKFSSTKTSDDELDAMAIGLTCFAIERF